MLTATTKNLSMRNMMCANKKKKNKCSAIKLKKKKKLVNSGAICLIILFASTLTTISLASNIGIVTAAAVAAQYVDTNSNSNNHKLNSNNKDNNNVDLVGNNLSVINNNNSNNNNNIGINSKINHNQSAVVALVPSGPVFKPSSSNVLIPKLEPNEFILPSKTVDPPRRKDFGQLRMYQPIQPFPSIFLSRSSYEDLPQVPTGINTATTFDVTELSKAIEKRLKNIRNLELGVSVVQVSASFWLNFEQFI